MAIPSSPIDVREIPLIEPDQINVSEKYRDDLKGILLTGGGVKERINVLASELDDFPYDPNNIPLAICMLNGAMYFYVDLVKRMETPVEFATLKASSYQGEKSIGEVTFSEFDFGRAEGRDIIVVEDIVDTGLTIDSTLRKIEQNNPRSCRAVALFDKPEGRLPSFESLYVDRRGFIVPNEFLIGYGLDFNGKYRNLPHVGVLKDELRP